ncbi:MAG: cobalamin-dependent protein, partial [Desulfuromonadales bacterium]|nr:cobalamin-dependent protein [Desulfuromonadales bacterium]
MKIVFPTIHVRRSHQAIALAAGCLSAALPSELGVNSVLLDIFPDQSDQEVLTSILEHNPDVVSFSVYLWNRQRVIAIANQLRQQRSEIQLIAGGPEVTGNLDGLAESAPWTALIQGEGEAPLAALLRQLAQGAEPQPIPGVTRFCPERPQSAPLQPRPELDELPSPWLTGVLQPQPGGGVLWEVARGCAFSCDYCFDARGYSGVRTLERERLEAELELFVENGVSQVWVLDATFNFPPKRGIELL